jgi:hypothetical protein
MNVWTATCKRSGGDQVIIKAKFARSGRRHGALTLSNGAFHA